MRWQVKAAIQSCFALLPNGEYLNFLCQRMIGSHSPATYLGAFRKQNAKLEQLSTRFPIAGKVVVEIGTGWNAIGVIALHLCGAKEIHTYDHVPHVRLDLVRGLLTVIAENEPRFRNAAEELLKAPTLEAFFEATHTRYLAPGDASRTHLPDRSVDLVYSYGVLEHIPKQIVEAILEESARILRSDGISFHRIDIADHFSWADPSITEVNFLKYPEWIWNLVNNKIQFHNRLRTVHYLDMFARHGGEVTFREEELYDRGVEAAKTLKFAVHGDLPPEVVAVAEMDVDVSFKEAHRRKGWL